MLHAGERLVSSVLLQIITALEEDPTAQKMQLGYRLQQIAAAVEIKSQICDGCRQTVLPWLDRDSARPSCMQGVLLSLEPDSPRSQRVT